jgi:hypothetical protein
MCYLHTLTTTSLSISSLMHLITNLVHASSNKANILHTTATIDKELLYVVATLQEFRSILLGAELHIHTDHKNILNIDDSSHQQLCWISYVDEYGPELHYVEGPCNAIADTLSRLLCNNVSSPLVGKKAANVVSDSEIDDDNRMLYSSLIDDRKILDCLLNLPCISFNRKQKKKHAKKNRKIYNRKILSSGNKSSLLSSSLDGNIYFCNSTVEQCYLNLHEDMVEDNPLYLENIKERQDKYVKLIQSIVRHPTWYSFKTIKDVEDILCYTKPGDNAANWRNCIT